MTCDFYDGKIIVGPGNSLMLSENIKQITYAGPFQGGVESELPTLKSL